MVALMLLLHPASVAYAAPPPATFPQDGDVADVAIYGTSSSAGQSAIEAPSSSFEITTSSSYTGTLQISINYVCSADGGAQVTQLIDAEQGGTGVGNPGNLNSPSCTQAEVNNGTVKTVSTTVDMSTIAANNSQYDNQLKVIDMTVTKPTSSGPGHQPFTVTVTELSGSSDTNLNVSYQTNPERYNSSAISSVDKSFAIWPNASGEINLPFAPICGTSLPETVYLKWNDTDAGSASNPTQPAIHSGLPGPNLTTQLIDKTTGQPVWPIASTNVEGSSGTVANGTVEDENWLGGPGSDIPRESAVTLEPDQTYVWQWTNVNDENAIQLAVPYSDSAATINCHGPQNQTPIGNLNVDCNTSSYTLSGEDPDHPNSSVNYQVRYDDSGGGVDFSGTTSSSGTSGPHAFSTRTYVLMIQDIDNKQWYEVDSDSTTCPPPGGGLSISIGCYNTSVDITGDTGNRVYVVISGTDHNVGNSGDITGTGFLVKNNTSYNFSYNPKPDVMVTTDTQTYSHITNSWGSDNTVTQTLPCLHGTPLTPSGTCTMMVTNGLFGSIPNAPSNSVQTGQGITVAVTITSTGQVDLPQSIDGVPLGLTNNTSATTLPGAPVPTLTTFNSGVSSAAPQTFYFNLPAQGTPGQYALSGYPDYNGYAAVGPSCTINIDVYGPFTIQPGANFQNTNFEDPVNINYVTTGLNNGSPTIPATSSSWVTYQAYGSASSKVIDGTHSVAHNYGSASDTFTFTNPEQIQVGDQYCANVSISPGTGLYSPGASPAFLQTSAKASQVCQNVSNEPYVHFFGSDVIAGGCGTNNGAIDTFNEKSYNSQGTLVGWVGSGSQLAALSLGQIEGFSTAFLRTIFNTNNPSYPGAPIGLTFANYSSSGGVDTSNFGTTDTSTDGNLGGDFNENNFCSTNYYQSLPSGMTYDTNTSMVSPGLTIPTPVTAQSTQPGAGGATKIEQYYQPPSASNNTLTITGQLNFPNNTDETIYVNGNVYIAGNICYGTCASDPKDTNPTWSSPTAIPSLFIVTAPGYNIYIGPGVTELDGVYVAEANSNPNTGYIDTCAQASGPLGATSIFGSNNTCGKQLTVYGAFVAQNIFLNRTYSSLRFANFGEDPQVPPMSPRSCGMASTSTTPGDVAQGASTSEYDCAAEIFNFSPELYLSQPAITPSSTSEYLYVTSLPPVL
jgi:hypothetical protein